MKEDLKQEFGAIITEYVSTCKILCNELKEKYKTENLLTSWRQNNIPRDGYLDKSRKVSFSLHGIGCIFRSDSFVIDLDFGKNGRCDGFDLWRLKNYITRNSKFENSVFRSYTLLETTFNELVKNKEIACPKWQPSPHLYYFIDSI